MSDVKRDRRDVDPGKWRVSKTIKHVEGLIERLRNHNDWLWLSSGTEGFVLGCLFRQPRV
jgi:hypothetical protein